MFECYFCVSSGISGISGPQDIRAFLSGWCFGFFEIYYFWGGRTTPPYCIYIHTYDPHPSKPSSVHQPCGGGTDVCILAPSATPPSLKPAAAPSLLREGPGEPRAARSIPRPRLMYARMWPFFLLRVDLPISLIHHRCDRWRRTTPSRRPCTRSQRLSLRPWTQSRSRWKADRDAEACHPRSDGTPSSSPYRPALQTWQNTPPEPA